jgi:hypothetical protein
VTLFGEFDDDTLPTEIVAAGSVATAGAISRVSGSLLIALFPCGRLGLFALAREAVSDGRNAVLGEASAGLAARSARLCAAASGTFGSGTVFGELTSAAFAQINSNKKSPTRITTPVRTDFTPVP